MNFNADFPKSAFQGICLTNINMSAEGTKAFFFLAEKTKVCDF